MKLATWRWFLFFFCPARGGADDRWWSSYRLGGGTECSSSSSSLLLWGLASLCPTLCRSRVRSSSFVAFVCSSFERFEVVMVVLLCRSRTWRYPRTPTTETTAPQLLLHTAAAIKRQVESGMVAYNRCGDRRRVKWGRWWDVDGRGSYYRRRTGGGWERFIQVAGAVKKGCGGSTLGPGSSSEGVLSPLGPVATLTPPGTAAGEVPTCFCCDTRRRER